MFDKFVLPYLARALKFDFKLDVCFIPRPTPTVVLSNFQKPNLACSPESETVELIIVVALVFLKPYSELVFIRLKLTLREHEKTRTMAYFER